MPRSPLSAFLLALALALSTPAAAAVDPSTGEQTGQGAPDDSELSAFVAAFLRLVGVQHGYMMLMRDENDPGKLEEIKRSALVDMKAAVERDGLTVDRYNQLAVSVRDDPQVRDRVEGMLQQMAADPSEDGVPDGGEE